MNVNGYLQEGLLKRERNAKAQHMYLENAELSLTTATELLQSPNKPYLWVIVTSYYAMFYIANAVLLQLGYRTQHRIVHKVTYDALVELVRPRLQQALLDGYAELQRDALDIAAAKTDALMDSYYWELRKRSAFQYEMSEQTKHSKAETSLKRANEFVFEMRKLLSKE